MDLIVYSPRATEDAVPRTPRIAEWIERNGHRIVDWLGDTEAERAMPLGRRPRLAAALAQVADKRADGIVLDGLALDINLLSDYGDIADQEALLAWLWAYEVVVFDGTSEVEKIHPDLVRQHVRELMSRGITFTVEVSRAEVERIVEPLNAQTACLTLRQAYYRGRTLRDTGATWQAIADVLNAEGYPVRRKGVWWAASVQRFLEGMPPSEGDLGHPNERAA